VSALLDRWLRWRIRVAERWGLQSRLVEPVGRLVATARAAALVAGMGGLGLCLSARPIGVLVLGAAVLLWWGTL